MEAGWQMPVIVAVTCHLAEGPRCLDVPLNQALGFNKPDRSKAREQSPVSHASLTLIQVTIRYMRSHLLFFEDPIDAANVYSGFVHFTQVWEWRDQREMVLRKMRTILSVKEKWENLSVSQ